MLFRSDHEAAVAGGALVPITVEPSSRKRLCQPSPLMIAKLFHGPSAAVGRVAGQLESGTLINLDRALRGWLEVP